jgi:hypothetical protein
MRPPHRTGAALETKMLRQRVLPEHLGLCSPNSDTTDSSIIGTLAMRPEW